MAKSQNTTIKTTRAAKILGIVIGVLMKIWSMTLRYNVNDKGGIVQPEIHSEPVIFALWHNRIFTMPPIWQKTGGKNRKTVVLTSASKDGSILSAAMSYFRIGAIRGSSSRRAISALIGMKKSLREGFDVCITPDGPKGPRYRVQAGVIKIAQSTSTKVIPIHIYYSSFWQLNSWDKFVIPKPFSKVSVTFAPPFTVPKGISEEEFEMARIGLETQLRNAVEDSEQKD